MASINLKSASIVADYITANTEFEAERLEIVARDGNGHYAVRWDAGDRWMAGEFVALVALGDDPQLYPASDEDREFRSEDGEVWRAVKQSDGGFKWVDQEASKDTTPATPEITRQALDAGKIKHSGWTPSRDTADQCGVNVVDYFGSDGEFLGPDINGVEPTFEAAAQHDWDGAVKQNQVCV